MTLRELLYLQKADRTTLLVLLAAACACLVLLFVTRGQRPNAPLSPKDSLALARQTQRKVRSTRSAQHWQQQYYQVEGRRTELFDFDPNTADSTQLLRLGLRPWQVRNIYKYRAAGGIYRQPKDFARLYGLTRKQYLALEPHIRISDDYLDASTIYNYEPVNQRDTVRSPIKLKPLERIAVNTADTTMLKKVPGIGSHFARKIVEYRQRLGGYVDIAQLTEIPDFPETALNFFTIPDDHIRKLNINKLSVNELRKHPYINYFQAKAIVDYRRLHGPLHSLRELNLLSDFPEQSISRLEPYVEY